MLTSSYQDYVGKSLMKVFDVIRGGMFGATQDFNPLIDGITNHNDHYLTCHDFYSYCEC